MKIVKMAFLFAFLCLYYAPAVLAQNGAVIIRGEEVIAGAWSDDAGLLVLAVSDSDFFCVEPEALDELSPTMLVIRPDGSLKYMDHGAYYTRVFFPATWDDFFADPCDFWTNFSLVAEGITHSTYNDNDVDPTIHPNRRNVWGYTVAGTLYEYAGVCSSGMTDLNIVERYMLKKDFPDCAPDCLLKHFMKGPRLKCTE